MGKRARVSLLVAAAALVLAGVVVRVAGLFTDLWVDEIWTLQWGLWATNPLNLVTVYKFKHDNNHLLNSAFIHFIGAQSHPWVYRLFALTCGVLTIPATWLLVRRHGRVAAGLAVVLVASCYQLAHYSSESRGYAPAAFFAVVAWLLLERFLDGRRWYDALGFWLAVMLGLLSHLTFLYAYAALITASAARVGPGWRKGLTHFAALHMIPLAFTFALWAEFVRPMRVGGGPEIGTTAALLDYAAQLVATNAVVVVACAALLLAVAAWRADRWLFAGLTLAIVIALSARDPRFVYGRYFLIATPFLLVALARWLATLRPPWAALVLGLWTVAQVWLTIPFALHGRGHYSEAVAYLAERQATLVGSGQARDFRDSQLVSFHGRARGIRYVGPDHPEVPAWLVYSSDDGTAPNQVERNGRPYVLDRAYPFAGLSGGSWHVYRVAERPPYDSLPQ